MINEAGFQSLEPSLKVPKEFNSGRPPRFQKSDNRCSRNEAAPLLRVVQKKNCLGRFERVGTSKPNWNNNNNNYEFEQQQKKYVMKNDKRFRDSSLRTLLEGGSHGIQKGLTF